MIKVEPGDWVLIDHPMLMDLVCVVRVASATSKSVMVNRGIRDDDQDGRRARKAIKGVFKSEAQARQARETLVELRDTLSADQKAVLKRYYTAALGTLLAEVPE